MNCQFWLREKKWRRIMHSAYKSFHHGEVTNYFSQFWGILLLKKVHYPVMNKRLMRFWVIMSLTISPYTLEAFYASSFTTPLHIINSSSLFSPKLYGTPKGLSRSKCVCLKQVSCFTTMYVVKWWHAWWHALETSVMPHVSSACHHFTTYIVVKHDTCFKHTRFDLDKL